MKLFVASTALAATASAVSINPKKVSSMLADTENEWIEQAVIGMVQGAPGEATAKKEMVSSCSELVGSIIKASEGEKERVEEYFGDVCSASKQPKRCTQFQDELLKFMTDDAERNREDLNGSEFCTGFFSNVKDYAYAEAKRRTLEKEQSAKKAKAQAKQQKLLAEKREKLEKEEVQKRKHEWFAKKEKEAKAAAEAEQKRELAAEKAKQALLKKKEAELKQQKAQAAKDAVAKKAQAEKEAKAKVAKAVSEAESKKQKAEKEATAKKQAVEDELKSKKAQADKELKETKAKHEASLKKVTKLTLKKPAEPTRLQKAKDVFFKAEAHVDAEKAKFQHLIDEISTQKVTKPEAAKKSKK